MSVIHIAQLTIQEGRRRLIVRLATLLGIAFLILFGVGMHYIFKQFEDSGFMTAAEMAEPANILTLTGLYVINFLLVVISVLISVASISNEIDTHVIDTIVTKPVQRWQIVLGKWLGFVVLIVLYTLFMAGGVILIAYFRIGLVLFNIPAGLSLMALNAIVVMTVTIAGGTRLSTLANGVVGLMLYAFAFIGGWVETIGSLFRNEIAVNIGIISSLIMPVEALWRKAALFFQPRLLGDPRFGGPLTVTSEPSDAMIVYALIYVVVLLGVSMWSLTVRDL